MNNTLCGIRPIMEAIAAGRTIDKVMVKKGSEGPLMTQLRELCLEKRIPVQEVPVEKLNRTAKGNHQGAVALVSEIVYAEIAEVLEAIAANEETPLIVVLDGVTDVRNFGAIARSAECAGAHAIVVSTKNGAPVNAESMKSSAGALSILPVCRTGSIRNTLKYLKENGLQLVAATEKSNTLLWEADMKKPSVVIMGAEDKGVSGEVMKMCDVKLAIPLMGSIESLNVSAAAAVMLFECVRQRKMEE